MALVTASQFQLTPNIGRAISEGLNIANQFQNIQQQGTQFSQQQSALTEQKNKQQINDMFTSVANAAVKARNLPDDESRVNFLIQRQQDLKSQGIDSGDTVEALKLFQSGQAEKANALIDSVIKTAEQTGFLKPIKSKDPGKTQLSKNFEQLKSLENNLKIANKSGNEEQINLANSELSNFKGLSGKFMQSFAASDFDKYQKLLTIDPEIANEFGKKAGFVKTDSQKFKEGQLTSFLQKTLDKAQTASVDASNRSRQLNTLANDIKQLDIGGGLLSTVTETIKSVLGTQEDVTNLRRRYNAVRTSQSVQNLPPGPASDKDIQLALSGFPKENANAEQIISFLKGTAKIENIDAAFQEFKSDLISNDRSTKGLLKKWKSKVASEALGRDITISELFITAQEEGISVDELKSQLGVK